jgi:dTDP-4-amino-4,6-dideoxygalactose transaminase
MYQMGIEEERAAARVIASQALFRYMPEATESDDFEKEFAAALGTPHAMLTSSGTAALICALAGMSIGPGDEVLMPAYAYVADVIAVLAVGAVPVICEIDESISLDPAEIGRRRTSRTRAVLPVHMAGIPSDMAPIMAAAREYGLVVIEDACQAIGGSYRGRRLGTIGDAGAFSFNQAKIITAGEGGAVVTGDDAVRERAFVMHDASSYYDGVAFQAPIFAGLQFRINEVSAAILRVQLTRLPQILDRLRDNRRRLLAALAPLTGVAEAPLSDEEGTCGSAVALLFDDPAACVRARAALSDVDGGAWAYQGIALGHSFFEWDLLHQRRGGHHPGRNPLLEADLVQQADSLGHSRALLERTLFIGYGLELADATIERIGQRVGDALS